MKIDNQDIICTAQELRDEENRQLHVSPWNHHHRVHIPTWLVAIPAAAIIGFVLGIWTQASSQTDTAQTALVDTVYIKEPAMPSLQDSVIQDCSAAVQTSDASTPIASTPVARPTATNPSAKGRLLPSSGRSVAEDHIRYDLLVRN